MNNIEVAHESGIVLCQSYADALLYCQFYEQDGNRGWRLPTNIEIDEWYSDTGQTNDNIYWAEDDVDRSPLYRDDWWVAPIRDIKMKAYRVAFTIVVDDNNHPKHWIENLINEQYVVQDSLSYSIKELPLEEPDMTLKLYLLTQNDVHGYDTYDSLVVAAESEAAARLIGPTSDHKFGDNSRLHSQTWTPDPAEVNVKLIGIAAEGTTKGVILASFNAG